MRRSLRSALREWVVNAALLAVSLAVIYAGAELYVGLAVDDGMQFDLEMWRYTREAKRVADDPAIGHEHRPNARLKAMGVALEINADGLRDRDIPLARTPGVARMLMLGDSLTLGWGVPLERTYAKRLEAIYAAAGRPVEVINAGVGNYNTAMEVAWFLARGARYQPDLVVLNYFINDAEPTPGYETGFLARHSRAYVFFASRFDAAMRHAGVGGRADWQGYYADLYDPARNAAGLQQMREAIARLADYCRANGIRLVIANYPELRVLEPYPFPFVDELVQSLARQHDVPYLPMLPAVRKMDPPSLWVTRPDPHPSAAAHEAFARLLYESLRPHLPGAQ